MGKTSYIKKLLINIKHEYGWWIYNFLFFNMNELYAFLIHTLKLPALLQILFPVLGSFM